MSSAPIDELAGVTVQDNCFWCREEIRGEGFLGTINVLDRHLDKCIPARPEPIELASKAASKFKETHEGKELAPEIVAQVTAEAIKNLKQAALEHFAEKKPELIDKLRKHQAKLESDKQEAKQERLREHALEERASRIKLEEARETAKAMASFKDAAKAGDERIPELIKAIDELPGKLAAAMAQAFAAALADLPAPFVSVKAPERRPMEIVIRRDYKGSNAISGAEIK